jgi:D-alanyl-D-alanine carboxypeptidase
MVPMKKSFLCLFVIATIALGGCRNSSDDFLAYEDSAETAGHTIDTNVSQGNFFAENIAVVSEEDNIGGDDLLNSGSTLLINVTDNQVIYADHVYDKMYPASLTKLLTALVVLNHGELTDSVTISYNASHIEEPGARVCGYLEGDVISMEALLNSLLVYSGNDAAIAIADHIGGSEEEFIKIMNEEATKIGAVHSNFVNSSGLHDDNQFTTAYDMYLIFNALLKYDTFRNIIGTDSYTAVYKDKDGNNQEKVLNSTNSFLGTEDPESANQILGGLTGATSKAGSCCILLSKDSNNNEYIAMIMKAADSDTLHSQISHLLTLEGSN